MRRFTAQGRNTGFICENCGASVPPLAQGSCRNHCPECLHSKHVDIYPGDRANGCGGLLEPVSATLDARRGYMIVHRCQRCGEIRRNRAAPDDPAAADNFELLIELSTRPAPE